MPTVSRRMSTLPGIPESPQHQVLTRRLSLGANVPVNQRPDRRASIAVASDPPNYNVSGPACEPVPSLVRSGTSINAPHTFWGQHWQTNAGNPSQTGSELGWVGVHNRSMTSSIGVNAIGRGSEPTRALRSLTGPLNGPMGAAMGPTMGVFVHNTAPLYTETGSVLRQYRQPSTVQSEYTTRNGSSLSLQHSSRQHSNRKPPGRQSSSRQSMGRQSISRQSIPRQSMGRQSLNHQAAIDKRRDTLVHRQQHRRMTRASFGPEDATSAIDNANLPSYARPTQASAARGSLNPRRLSGRYS